jgi:hypothetical protein
MTHYNCSLIHTDEDEDEPKEEIPEEHGNCKRKLAMCSETSSGGESADSDVEEIPVPVKRCIKATDEVPIKKEPVKSKPAAKKKTFTSAAVIEDSDDMQIVGTKSSKRPAGPSRATREKKKAKLGSAAVPVAPLQLAEVKGIANKSSSSTSSRALPSMKDLFTFTGLDVRAEDIARAAMPINTKGDGCSTMFQRPAALSVPMFDMHTLFSHFVLFNDIPFLPIDESGNHKVDLILLRQTFEHVLADTVKFIKDFKTLYDKEHKDLCNRHDDVATESNCLGHKVRSLQSTLAHKDEEIVAYKGTLERLERQLRAALDPTTNTSFNERLAEIEAKLKNT